MTPTEPKPAVLQPIRVRRRLQEIPLLARKLTARTEISCLDGRQCVGEAGDYAISYDNGVAVDVVGPQEYARSFVPIEGATGLTLTADQLARIAKCVRFGATHSAEELTNAIEGLAYVSVGDVRLPFTPGQIAELKLRADKRGMTYDAYVKLIVDFLFENFFIAKA